ncbi:hypothetical protein L873DRAFT_1816957 [Choiromyces venosus 120613-1]|uniref:Uncharacterized protein n=1 Tax=Choiromyces venosus 120613-1 TaxID=1336337 RepID=A0A3N4J3A6_9PEZI|nr:hypothetical protein L873DRAFT_1816957 [Choiromyces venosus 120613-1]
MPGKSPYPAMRCYVICHIRTKEHSHGQIKRILIREWYSKYSYPLAGSWIYDRQSVRFQ